MGSMRYWCSIGACMVHVQTKQVTLMCAPCFFCELDDSADVWNHEGTSDGQLLLSVSCSVIDCSRGHQLDDR